MQIKDVLKFILAVLLLGTTIALAAFEPVNDDTDIFLTNPTIAAERPNVLIILDNTANWNQPFDNEKSALVQVVNGLTDQFNVGLMMFPETGGSNDSIDGGYVRFHVRQMTLANKTALASMVNNLSKLADKGNNATVGLALHEAYLYFSGKTSIASHGKVKTDKDGTADPLLSPLSEHALPSGTSPALYRSPIKDGCQRSFVIYISNGPANENASARADLQAKLQTLTGVTPPAVISITPDGQQSNWADEMAKFMANADVFATSGAVPNSSGVQNVYTYTVEVDPAAGANIINVTTGTAHALAVNDPVTIAGTTNFNGSYTVSTVVSTTKFTILATISPSPATEGAGTVAGKTITEISQNSSDMTALLKSMAANGKGKYFGVTSGASGTTIVDALNSIFTEVQAVNSVFASTTLPVSVNVRGTNLNQVYIGVFRPDSTKSPRWLGNLKMYNLALNSATGTVFLADASNGPPPAVGNPSENSTTGFVSQTSPSFWTTTSSYWGFRDASLNGPGGASDLPDGDLVEKGGAAQQLRIAFANAEASTTLRRLYTCTTGNVGGTPKDCVPNAGFALSQTPFATTNDAISAAALQLDTRFVSPLTAFETKAVTSLVDRASVNISNANPATSVAVTALANGAVTRTITGLTTSVPKSISALTSDVANTQSVGISTIKKVSGNFVVTTSGPIPANFANSVSGSPTVQITLSSVGVYNATWTISSLNTAARTFVINAAGNPGDATGGTATVTNGVAPSTTARATVGAHGYTSGQSVTITGATPNNYNGTFNITVTDVDHFSYTMVTAPGSSGNATGSISASGNTTVATATHASATAFLFGSTVTVSGASIAAYNGTKTVLASPAPTATTFSYSVGATAIGPNTSSPVYAVQGGSTTVTVTTADEHQFVNGDSVVITGSNIAGYNGTWTISCTPAPACANATTFTYTTASVLPANTSTSVSVAAAGSTLPTVTATATNHGFVVGNSVVIESTTGDTVHPGTYTVVTVPNANTFTYSTGTAKAAPSGSYTVRPPTASSRATATVTAHGYGAAGATRQVIISSAAPAIYNGTKTATIVDANTFTYPLTGATGTGPGANTSAAVTSSIKTTTARATSVNHGFSNGSSVTIAGATPSAFNGPFTITTTGADSFTYTIATAEGDASGTISAAQASGPSPERDRIINWVRGQDNFQDENSNSSTTDIRASVHGDVLHSRPAVVNYNRFAGSDDDVFVFYGGNDGIFHAVKGGYAKPAADTSTLTPGQEAWGFVPSEFFSHFKRMRNNAPMISNSFKKPYFMDGPIGTYAKDNTVPPNDKLGDPIGTVTVGTTDFVNTVADVVNLYIANRRGGRFLYALDVNTPTNPKFLWKIANTTSGFGELGQTWSQPTVVSGLAGVSTPVLVFGAGYDAAVDDLDPMTITAVNTTTGAVTVGASSVSRTMGRGIYVVNALTGAPIWRALGATDGVTVTGMTTKIVPGMVYAIPSDVTVVRNETTGVPNRAYVGDTGGNLWRIDFKQDPATLATDPDNLSLTTVTKLASIADTTTTATITDASGTTRTVIPGLRKFLFPPDVVGQTGGFDAILLGSGDREHPFDTAVTNRFYMFKDRGGDTTGAVTGATLCDPTITEGTQTADSSCDPITTISGLSDLTSNCIQSLAGCTGGETQAGVTTKLGTDRGWFITLFGGEKVVGNAISIGGTTFFNTNQPSATAGGGTCGSNLGVARQYQVATADASATSDLNAVGGLTGADRSLIHAGGGYLPSPVHVVVMLGGKPVEAVISGIQVSTPAGATLSARLRKFWFKEVDPK